MRGVLCVCVVHLYLRMRGLNILDVLRSSRLVYGGQAGKQADVCFVLSGRACPDMCGIAVKVDRPRCWAVRPSRTDLNPSAGTKRKRTIYFVRMYLEACSTYTFMCVHRGLLQKAANRG